LNLSFIFSQIGSVFYSQNFVFLLLDGHAAALAHHLLTGALGTCIFASPIATGCIRVEADSTSRKNAKEFLSIVLKTGKVFAVSLFMWWERFTGCHKTATVGVCFLEMHYFPLPDAVWCECYLPHALHGAMLKLAGCGCSSMQRPS
jgi:hypothetical protein